MSNLSRRKFLRNASIGAATAGVLAATGTGILSAFEASEPAPATLRASEETAHGGTDVFARVIDAKSGHIKVYMGTKAVEFTDVAMAQRLLRAAK